MKKVILILLTILISSTFAQAQIIETDSKIRTVIKEPEKPKAPRFTYYTAKIGGGMFKDKKADLEKDPQFKGCANIELGIIHQLNDYGLYVGGEIGGIITELYKDKDDDNWMTDKTTTGVELHIGPTIGIIKPIKVNLEFDGHVGTGYGYCSIPDATSFFQSEIGAGVWYKRYFAGVEAQGYFKKGDRMPDGNVYENNDYAILLNFGIRF